MNLKKPFQNANKTNFGLPFFKTNPIYSESVRTLLNASKQVQTHLKTSNSLKNLQNLFRHQYDQAMKYNEGQCDVYLPVNMHDEVVVVWSEKYNGHSMQGWTLVKSGIGNGWAPTNFLRFQEM